MSPRARKSTSSAVDSRHSRTLETNPPSAPIEPNPSHERPVAKDKFELAQAFWREHMSNPLMGFSVALAQKFKQGMVESGAEEELASLTRHGVRPETLAICSFLFAFAPTIDKLWRSMSKNERDKRKQSKVLYEAAKVLESFESTLNLQNISIPFESIKADGFQPPSSLAKTLRTYAEMLHLRERVLKALDANSFLEIAKYTLASSVYRITGKYHDREVSGIVGVMIGDPDLDETAYRVWRIRTIPRLNRSIAILPTHLHAFNSVFGEFELGISAS